ncbi:ABC transporter substrate-binding protein [Antrihabitans sp. YC2-6]|uniref:ABC transporter substrate-binding protein n=1 Tax=Antrihabitans sp. YC2-6 TaxID=2799498 RepID=UPI0027DDCEC0|nr:ABC transporter substrate-binding protein [Antrihabitans sp. YC2-6]
MTAIAITALVAAGCGGSSDDGADSDGAIVVGTADRVEALDPAAAQDQGSSAVMNQVYRYLLNYPPSDQLPRPDAAERCDFTQPTVYTCVVKDGLEFANGNPLTAASVKYSFDRIAKINDKNGPATLLAQLDHVDVVDPRTVAFTIRTPNDQTFPRVLASEAGPIIDEKIFPPDTLLDDDAIVAGKPFAGPYTISNFQKDEVVELEANPDYDGALGKAKSPKIRVRYFGSPESLTTATDDGSIDVGFDAYRPADVESLRDNSELVVHQGPGDELHYLVFNFDTMPGGSPEQKWAVRKAIASSIDRDALVATIYNGTFAPAYSVVPEGFPDAVQPFRDLYGDKPNKEAAARFAAESGVPTPIVLDIEHCPEHYGPTSTAEYEAIEAQLESTGLFTVNLKTAAWDTYDRDRVQNAYPEYEHRWEAVLPDPDEFIVPLFGQFNVLQNHFASPVVDDLIRQESTELDPVRRAEQLRQLQDELARTHIPVLPLVSSKHIAVAQQNVQGVPETLDVTGKLRFTTLTKS